MDDTNEPQDPHDSPFARFAALVRRELGAEDVRLLEATAPIVEAPNALYTQLSDGSRLAVTFAAPPESPEALARRLDILVGTFAQSANEDGPARARFTVALSLHDELRALSVRAQAVDALVLDAHSPVVWGSATLRTPHEEPGAEGTAELRLVGDVDLEDTVQLLSREVPAIHDAAAENAGAQNENETVARLAIVAPPAPMSAHELRGEPPDEAELNEVSRRAIRDVRALEELPDLRKGKQLHHHTREPDYGYVAHSFAGIYVLVLVFEAEYDEIRAERAMQESMPRIERLVLALPPLDPTPEPRANVISLRRARRR